MNEIKDIETGEVGKVQDLLSTQFTAVLPSGKVQYYFYRDRDITWMEAKE